MRKSRIALTVAAVAAAVVAANPQAASAAPETLPEAIIVTFDVVGEQFKVGFDDPEEIKKVYTAVDDEDGQDIPFPIGTVNWEGPGVNTGHAWHLENAQMTDWSIEWCDGRPSDVVLGGWKPPQYCPWGATVVAVQEVAPVVATFALSDGTFKVRFTEPDEIVDLYDLFDGKVNKLPVGTVVWGRSQVNDGFTWHLADAVLDDVATEVCDGRLGDVVEGRWKPAQFCPWSAKLTSILVS